MAAAAILNFLFLSILVKWSISCGSCIHHCKMTFIYVNRRLELLMFVQKSKMAEFCNAGPPTKFICAPETPLQISC